eukprot:scaffold442_cov268-Pinguiococcus_pyrenoidosus.AAC.13
MRAVSFSEALVAFLLLRGLHRRLVGTLTMRDAQCGMNASRGRNPLLFMLQTHEGTVLFSWFVVCLLVVRRNLDVSSSMVVPVTERGGAKRQTGGAQAAYVGSPDFVERAFISRVIEQEEGREEREPPEAQAEELEDEHHLGQVIPLR